MSNKVRKNLMLIAIISFCILVLGGTSYALLRSEKTSANNYVINVGDVEVTFQGATNSLNVDKMYPMTDAEGAAQEKELVFTVKNTGSVKAYFNVSMEETSTNPEFKSVLKYIVKKDPGEYNQPVILSDNKYIDYNASLDPDGEYTYHVKVYLAEEADNTYMGQTFTAKIHIEASQEPYEEKVETKTAVDVLKEKLGTDGLVGVKEDNTMTTAKEDEVREYRYSGATADNYVTFNDEKWRIIGIFKDEDGNEHMKIIRNDFLTTEMPATYQADGKTFQINSSNYGRWDYDGSNYNNNWADAGLMYWLNSKGTDSSDTGYLNKISSTYRNMIYETKWYLGNIVYSTDTPVTAYEHERGSTTCSSSCSGGDVWSGNSATWTGKIGLMYPSDMGFSTDSSNWTSNMYDWSSTQLNTTWLKEGHTTHEWFLSPSSRGSDYVATRASGGSVTDYSAYNGGCVRPVLYLKSDTTINGGEGTSTTPYTLSGN